MLDATTNGKVLAGKVLVFLDGQDVTRSCRGFDLDTGEVDLFKMQARPSGRLCHQIEDGKVVLERRQGDLLVCFKPGLDVAIPQELLPAGVWHHLKISVLPDAAPEGGA